MRAYVDNLVYDDADALAVAAALHMATVLADTVRDRGEASMCLAGGGTPEAAYRALGAMAEPRVDWGRVHAWFGDERCVAPDSAESNFAMAHRALLSQVAIPAANVHRIPAEEGCAMAARRYDVALHEAFPDVMDTPSFDLLVLGVGPDGHVASLFPGSEALGESRAWAVEVEAPHIPPRIPRVTLTPPILRRARRVLYLVAGATKRDVVRRVLLGSDALPASLFHGREQTLWLLDLAASPGHGGG